jgi:tartrate dehydrogenase/decarboxylase/D-malate dehydrogenase
VSRELEITVIAGDGIGQEVMPSALAILDAVAPAHDLSFAFDIKPWGCDYFKATGTMMPDGALAEIAGSDAILFGAVGSPDVPDHVSLWGLLIPIRRAFEQYVNLRPVLLFPGVESPLRRVPSEGLDLLIVRENTEGEYSQVGGRVNVGKSSELALQEAVFTRTGCERILTYAFQQAAARQGRLCVATKSNGLIHSMPFWDEITIEVADRYQEVDYQLVHVDALAAKLVLQPESLDVIVGTNLFGDILSDLAAAIAGSLGVAPSGNLNPERQFPSMFEPVHGSAPDIAGHGVANPVAQIWSAAMMLEHLGYQDAARSIVDALRDVTAAPETRTRDIGGTASTAEVTAAVLRALDTRG